MPQRNSLKRNALPVLSLHRFQPKWPFYLVKSTKMASLGRPKWVNFGIPAGICKMMPKWTKIIPKCIQNDTKMDPKWYQNESKMIPKWIQMISKWMQNDINIYAKWYQNGSKMIPKWIQNECKMISKLIQNDTKMVPNWYQHGSKMLPKWYQNWIQYDSKSKLVFKWFPCPIINFTFHIRKRS